MEGRRGPDGVDGRPTGAGRSAAGRQPPNDRLPSRQELVALQADISGPAVRVKDPQLDRPAGRRVSIPRNPSLSELADDVPAEPYPGSPAQLKLQTSRLLDSGGDRARQPGWLQDDQLDFRPPGDGRQTVYSIAQLGQ